MLRTPALAALLLLGTAGVVKAQVTYVDSSNTPPGAGTAQDPYTSLTYALDNLLPATTSVEVEPGTYVGDIEIKHGMIVRATQGPELTIIQSDGTGSLAAVNMWDGFPVLESFTVTGVQDNRPAVRIGSGTLGQVYDCVVRDNNRTGITGVYDAMIEDCTVVNNGGSGIVTQSGFAFWSVKNTIVWSNGIPSSFSAFGGCVEYNIIDSNYQSFCNPTSNAVVKPGFWARNLSDIHLKPGSPAIDAGDPTSPLDPDGTRADIGALKFSATYAPSTPQPYCTSRTNSQGCVPEIGYVGTPSASGAVFTVECTDVLNNKSGLFFYGFAGKATAYQGGWLCVQAPARRTAVQSSGGNPPPDDCSGAYTFDFDALLQSGADPMLFAGQSVFTQFWYRDPQQSGPFTTGRSEGLAFEVGP